MIWILYEKEYKALAEPYILAFFSKSRKKVGLIPYEREYLIDKNKENVMRFPDDFINIEKDKFDLDGFDYSILPDHGIENAYHANVFSTERKGRIYCDTGFIREDKIPEKYKKLPLLIRTREDILKDMNQLERRFFVRNFIIYTEKREKFDKVEFNSLYNVEIKNLDGNQ